MGVLVTAEDFIADGARLAVDLRSEEAYRDGHAPGALRLPLADWEKLVKQPDSGLERGAFWHDLLGRAGIDGSRPVALYDDGRFASAARAWFFLQLFGIDAVVIAGGWPALAAALGSGVEAGAVAPRPLAFTGSGRPRQAALMLRHELRDRLGSDLQIFDTRSQAEYDGTDGRKNPRPGHLPGARNLPHLALLNEDGSLKPAASLRESLAKAGFVPSQPIVTHCEGGGRAALCALAAIEAGYSQVAVYYPSFGDWSADPSCPVEK